VRTGAGWPVAQPVAGCGRCSSDARAAGVAAEPLWTATRLLPYFNEAVRPAARVGRLGLDWGGLRRWSCVLRSADSSCASRTPARRTDPRAVARSRASGAPADERGGHLRSRDPGSCRLRLAGCLPSVSASASRSILLIPEGRTLRTLGARRTQARDPRSGGGLNSRTRRTRSGVRCGVSRWHLTSAVASSAALAWAWRRRRSTHAGGQQRASGVMKN